jgi:hypothetical protein
MFLVRWGVRISANYNLGMEAGYSWRPLYYLLEEGERSRKVALDASADDAPAAGDCSKVNLP